MKILVLGGTQFFGKRLVNLLLDAGHDISVASRGKKEVQFKGTVERLTVDRGNAPSMQAALAGKTWDVVYDQICYNANEAKLAVELFSGKVGHLIFTSTMSVYGYGNEMTETWFNPNSYIPKTDNDDKYQEGKRQAEKVYALQKEMPVTAARIPLVMGEDDPTRRLRWHIARIKFGQQIYFPNLFAHISVISADDAAKFLAGLVDKNWHEPFNASVPTPLRLFDLVKSIESATGQTLFEGKVGNPETTSSYGVERDWVISSKKANEKGFSFSPVDSWLPSLIASEEAKTTEQDTKK